MEELDGNAIAGLLREVFSGEMTTARCTCAACGSARVVAELMVYLQAPGTVVRCPQCGSVMMVFLSRHSMNCVDLSGLAELAA